MLKFHLHISSDEQLARFKARLDDPTKQWKISEADYSERKLWPQYISAYEEELSRCSTERAPWSGGHAQDEIDQEQLSPELGPVSTI